ncbi:hypothetical protein CcaCcLH18_13720 [Colletotrichum camelliae]|nr:hypothetical protein CcaCcLH18_13720 [Colletotrichum camelliae]
MAKDDAVNSLSEQFSRLKADDPASEILHRRANLQNLIDTLSPWELVALRAMVRARTPQLSSMSDLPSELVSMIALHLTTKDALACAAISKGWRTVWTQPSVAKHLISTHFRELSPLLSLPSSDPASLGSPWETFVSAANKTIPRIDGNFISKVAVSESLYDILQTKTFEMDERSIAYVEGSINNGQSPSKETKKHYACSSGCVAWHIDAYAVFLDDLRAMTRTLIVLPDLVEQGKRDFVVYAMTENLIFFVELLAKHAMIVYHIDKKEFRRATLPNRVARITAHKEVAVLEFSVDNPVHAVPHVWRWGPGLAKLQMPPVQRKANQFSRQNEPRPEGFLFHPTQSNVIYYFAEVWSDAFAVEPEFDDDPPEVTVYKFEDLKHTNSFKQVFKEPHYEDSSGFEYEWQYIRCAAPINSHGLYGLFQYIPEDVSTQDIPVCRYNFDTVTEIFSETRDVYKYGMRRPMWGYEASGYRQEFGGGLMWNGQTYYLQKWRPHQGGDRDIQFTEWAGESARNSAVCVADDNSTLVLGPRDEPIIYEGLGIEEIVVDDDFVIGLAPMGYVAWNFGLRGAAREPWKRNGGLSANLPRYTDADTQCCVKGCKGPTSRRPCYICEAIKENMDVAVADSHPFGHLPMDHPVMRHLAMASAAPAAFSDEDEYDFEEDYDDDDDLMYGDEYY